MATTTLNDLAVLLHKISREVDTAEAEDTLKDVYSTLEPTIAEFKRLGAKARLHDVPEALWQSLTQTISTIMTLCEQRGLEKERKVWASKWVTFKESYEKGKAALAEERRRCATLKSENEALREKLNEAQTSASLQHLTATSDDKIQIEKLNEQVGELKLTLVSKERDDALAQLTNLQSLLATKEDEIQNMARERDEAQDRVAKLQCTLDELRSREPQFQQFRSSSHDINMGPLAHVQQLHPNIHSPSTGTPPSLLHSMRHTPPGHAYSMQHTPSPHMQVNNQYQSPSSLHGSPYIQSPARHSTYHGSPPLLNQYYQPGSPSHSHHQAPPPGTVQGPAYGSPSIHGHHSRQPPRPRTNGRDGTSRPQTAQKGANQACQSPLEDFFAGSSDPYDRHNPQTSKGVRWSEDLCDTPVMTMNRDAAAENERPSTSHSVGSISGDPKLTTASPSKGSSASPTKATGSASPTKASPTKYGTFKRKLKGMRRPPYGYMTGPSGGSGISEAILRLDHPIASLDGDGSGTIPAFVDENLESMKLALSPHLVALIWDKSCRRALRRRPEGGRGHRGVNKNLLEPLQFEKRKMRKLPDGRVDPEAASRVLKRSVVAKCEWLVPLVLPARIQVL